jgi:hypothetical protein
MSDLGFSYQSQGSDVLILRNGTRVTLLRGVQADKFRLSVERLDESGAQQLMARVTGNYKRGNERHARQRRARK